MWDLDRDHRIQWRISGSTVESHRVIEKPMRLPEPEENLLPPPRRQRSVASVESKFGRKVDVEEELKVFVPEKFQSSVKVRPLYERENVLTARIFIANIPLEHGDLKFRKRGPQWELLSGEVPNFKKISEFNEPADSALLGAVDKRLNSNGVLLKKSSPLGPSWILNERDELTPCSNVEVEYEIGRKVEHEKWCLDPLTLQLLRKVSVVKKF